MHENIWGLKQLNQAGLHRRSSGKIWAVICLIRVKNSKEKLPTPTRLKTCWILALWGPKVAFSALKWNQFPDWDWKTPQREIKHPAGPSCCYWIQNFPPGPDTRTRNMTFHHSHLNQWCCSGTWTGRLHPLYPVIDRFVIFMIKVCISTKRCNCDFWT